jgi:hypothetical protein
VNIVTAKPTTACGDGGKVYVNCDFSTLTAGAFNMETLVQTCGFSAFAFQGNLSRSVNVFDTSNIRSSRARDDTDLGSPNQGCGGPGVGEGGRPDAAFPNCVAQGNALIIQDPRVSNRPNDSGFGGCFVFQFFRQIELVNMAMLDVNEPNVSIKVKADLMIHWSVVSFTNK